MLVQEPYSVSQSVRRLTNLRFRDFFVFALSSLALSSLSSVFVGWYCTYGMSVTG